MKLIIEKGELDDMNGLFVDRMVKHGPDELEYIVAKSMHECCEKILSLCSPEAGWIAVTAKDKLPKADEAVIVSDGNITFALPHYYTSKGWFQYGGGTLNTNVKFHQPLPSPPKP